MATPYLVKTLRTLRTEFDAAYPGRDRRHDGWIGDAAHQRSKSDHNPDEQGRVCAVDLTASGAVGARLAQTAIAAMKRRGQRGYVIHAGRIANPSVLGGAWRTYTGSNPHTGHVHVSAHTLLESGDVWGVRPQVAPPAPVPAPPWPVPTGHKIGRNPHRRATWHDGMGCCAAGNAAIKMWQERMIARGWDALREFGADGMFGPVTERVVRQFQAEKGLSVTGSIDKGTWEAAWETTVE